MKPVIRLEHIEKVFTDGKEDFEALRDVSLEVNEGDIFGIIGLSGAGKSTILRCIIRMHDISKGELTVDGVTVDSLRGKELRRYRRKVGMIFQSFNLVSRSTVLKNVLTADVPEMPFWRVLFGVFTKEQKMRALESLDKVGILDKAYTRCDQLSGGQQQRVAIARALASDPEIIYFDEPTSALDPELTGEVLSVMRQLAEEGMTMLVVTHEMGFARNVSSKTVFMENGVVVEAAPSAEFFAHPREERTREFLRKIEHTN